MMFSSTSKRVILSGLLVPLLVLFAGIQPAAAQTFDPSNSAANIKGLITDETRNAKDKVGEVLLATGLSGLVNAFSFFMRKLAYDTAKYVAAGGNGQSSLVFEDGFDKYVSRTANSAFGEIIEEITDLTGLNLCNIGGSADGQSNADFSLFLAYSLNDLYGDGGPTANGCSWTEFRGNWNREAFQERFDSLDDLAGRTLDQVVTDEFLQTNRVDQSDFGVTIGVIGQLDRLRYEKEQAAIFDRLEGDGFRAVTDIISGDVRTPAQIVQKETEAITASKQSEISSQQIAGIYGSGALQVFPQALSVFANTLANDLLNKLLTDGLLPQRSGDGADALNPFAGPGNSRRQAAEQAFNFLFTSVPNRQLSAYDDDLIRQFASCPENPGVYNCVIDSNLQQAIERARSGEPLSIADALSAEVGLLNPDWAMVPPDNTSRNESNSCYREAFCYSNVQKLRKARILPLGFEIAASLGDPDNPQAVTLGDVVESFNDCAVDAAGVEYRDASHPYCHLIDPNWIIKMPEAICEAEVYSPILVSPEIPNRQTECADLATCVAYNSSGQCVSHGYCLQEENTWEMPGQSCPAEYATCRTYVEQSKGNIVSYLSRTVDIGMCSAGNVGCLQYSLEKSGEDWDSSLTYNSAHKLSAYANQVVHLSASIADPAHTCGAGDAGCTQLGIANVTLDGDTVLSASRGVGEIYLQKAPAYLGCYDNNRDATDGEDWPRSVAEAVSALESNAACTDYAPGCAPSEVGCNLWTPTVDGGISIPAKVGDNICNAACVGYDTFRQLSSTFEPGIDPLHFIPPTQVQNTCVASAAGCSEFTNIASGSLGGESLEYFTDIRHCEVPTAGNEKTFYSWEGSDTEGFVLRVHTLAQYTTSDPDRQYYADTVFAGEPQAALFALGAPKYAARTHAELTKLYADCSEETYNTRIADQYDEDAASLRCRELYDDDGNVYYRDIDQIVSVSSACVELRKTDTVLEVDTDITDAGVCSTRDGVWSDNDDDGNSECNVCRGSGKFVNGSCVYSTIISESESCAPAYNGCRAYVGNTGTNIRRELLGDFESDTVDEWVGADVSVSTESPFVDQSSLRIVGSAARVVSADTFAGDAIDSAYEIRFWARGVPQQVSVSLGTEQFGVVSIGDTWREFILGPVSISGAVTTDQALALASIGAAADDQWFVDNIELVRSNAYNYLIKNSWQTLERDGDIVTTLDVPRVCDSTPTDAFPGEALGCEEYRDQNGNSATVTGFASICREEAIGCTAAYETHDNDPVEEAWYGARCTIGSDVTLGATGLPAIEIVDRVCNVHVYPETVGTATEPLRSYSCTIARERDYCTLRTADTNEAELVLPPNGFAHIIGGTAYNAYADYANALVTTSTYVVPADTNVETPIFIANQKNYRCTNGVAGCTELGQELHVGTDLSDPESIVFNTVYHIIDPDTLTGSNGVLCGADTVGCAAFGSSGNVQYFKDPTITGNSLCDYRTNVRINGTKTNGWFQTGTSGSEPVPCYADYRTLDNEYGIWSNNSLDTYDSFVGVCAPQHNLCTEFVDRADTSRTQPDGAAYYAIFDDRLTARTDECVGQVGLKDGCVLLDQTNIPNKNYNTAATYRASEQNGGGLDGQYGLVDPISNTANDANLILKVQRDRQCAEWLECRLSRPEVDENGNSIDICILYDVCLAADASGTCTTWADSRSAGYCSRDIETGCYDDADCGSTGGSCVYQQALTASNYTNRDTSWYGRDYSGYSVLGLRPYADMTPVVFEHDPFSQYLAYTIPESTFAGENSESSCIAADGSIKFDLDSCGISDEGRCFEGSCVVPVSGVFSTAITSTIDVDGDSRYTQEDQIDGRNQSKYMQAAAELIDSSCKTYPEIDSPYGGNVLFAGASSVVGDPFVNEGIPRYRTEFVDQKSAFINANVYQDPLQLSDRYNWTSPYVSSCVYSKVRYQTGVTDYYPINQKRPKGLCTDQSNTSLRGVPCTPGNLGNLYCKDGNSDSAGTCAPLTEVQTHIGLEGFCLQKDLSTPINGGDDYACLVWLPMQTSASRVDIYNQEIQAGYYPVPEYDAPPTEGLSGGYFMCTESSNFGQGLATSEYRINRADTASLEQAYSTLGNAFKLAETDIAYRPSSAGGDAFSIADLYSTTELVHGDGFFSWCREPARSALESSVHIITQTGSDVTDLDTSGCDLADPEVELAPSELVLAYCIPITLHISGLDPIEIDACPDTVEALIDNFNNDIVRPLRGDTNLVTTETELHYPSGGTGSSSDAGCNNSYFDSLGEPRLACATEDRISGRAEKVGTARSRCSRFGLERKVKAGRYQTLVCGNTNDNPGGYVDDNGALYTMVQTWAWDPANIGNSAQVLRVEYASDDSSSRTAGYGDSGASQYALFPSKTMNTVHRYLYTDASLLTDQGQGNMPEEDIRKVYSTGVETELHEDMIQKVYVIPLRYPSGYSGVGPALMTKQFMIDFDQTSRSNIPAESVIGYLPSDGRGDRQTDLEFPDTQTSGGAVSTYAYQLSNNNKRYISVYHSDDFTITFPADGSAPSSDNDPFDSMECTGANWYAFALEFAPSGEFLGYNSAICNSSTSGELGMQVAIVAELLDICTEAVQVYDDTKTSAEYTNRAVTNVVWKEADNTPIGSTGLSVQTPLQPFGSISIQEPIVSPDVYVFAEPHHGAPLWCGTSDVHGLSFVPQFLNYCNALPDEVPRIPTVGSISVQDFFKQVDNRPLNTIPSAAEYLPPQIYAIDAETCQTRSSGSIARSIASSNADGNQNIDSVSKTEGCTVGPANTITINGMVGRTGEAFPDETNPDGSWVGMLGYATYPVTLQFFAFADHDRMPVRKIKVDFNDGDHSLVGDLDIGLYKNSKPHCASSIGECGDTQLTCMDSEECVAAGLTGADAICGTPEKNFGNQDRACTQDYHEYNYVYRCSLVDAQSSGITIATIANESLKLRALGFPGAKPSTPVCVYKPRVQVTDNWGWCNATDNSDPNKVIQGVNTLRLCNSVSEEVSQTTWTSFGTPVRNDDIQIYVIPKEEL